MLSSIFESESEDVYPLSLNSIKFMNRSYKIVINIIDY